MQALDKICPKRDNVVQGTHVKKVDTKIQVELHPMKNWIPGGFNSDIAANHGWVPKGIHSPKVELRNFDGTCVFKWVNQIKQ
jgi:hypothetical protein